jgi:hypothetical protein
VAFSLSRKPSSLRICGMGVVQGDHFFVLKRLHKSVSVENTIHPRIRLETRFWKIEGKELGGNMRRILLTIFFLFALATLTGQGSAGALT